MDKSNCAVVILENKYNQLLFYLRDNKPKIAFPNTWAFIAGLVEANETPLQTIVRETGEELKHADGSPYQLEALGFLFTYRRKDMPRDEHVFQADLNISIEDLVLTEGQKLGLFHCSKIDSTANIAPHHKEIALIYISEYK